MLSSTVFAYQQSASAVRTSSRRSAYPALALTIQIFGHDQIFVDYRQKKCVRA